MRPLRQKKKKSFFNKGMKKVFKSVACVLAATALSANVFAADDTELAEMGIVRGRVVDTENHTLPGASIFIEDLHTGVVSDIDGFYIQG